MSNQTYELARWIGAHLKDRKFPFRVIYAPERTDRKNPDPVILISRDFETSEKVTAPQGQQANGRKMRTRRVPLKVKIFARSTLDGARRIEHEELADYLVDALIIALEEWSSSERGGVIEYGEMAFMTKDELELEEPEGWSGVVYIMRFTIGRGVVKRDYLKQIRPTGTLTSASNRAEVRLDENDDPEVVEFSTPDDDPPEEEP